jgi:NAD(P)H-flavin reductase
MPVTRKIRCKVEHIEALEGSVYTVDLAPDDLAPRFRPGQFLHLTLDEYDPSGYWPESRIFSIASSPLKRDGLKISYSVRGRYTARMEKELYAGRYVWIKLPYGDFIIEGKTDVVLFAGGTGITAFTAFIDGLQPEFPHNIYLAYGARRRDLLLYREEIERKSRDVPQLTVRYFIEDGSGMPVLSKEKEAIGRVSVDPVWSLMRDPLSSTYFISGPPAMLSAITEDLCAHNVSRGSIRIDSWE